MTRAFQRLLIAAGLLFSTTFALSQPTFTITNVKNACAGLNNGSFDVNIITANGPVNLLIFGPPNFNRSTAAGLTETFTGLKPQSYIIIAQDVDGNNIQFQTITNVAPNISLSSAPVVVNNSNCAVPNGSITISPTGGSGAYSYSWTGPGAFSASTQNLTGIVAGNYVVTVSDNNANCSFTSAPIVVTDPLPSPFTVSAVSSNLCLGDVLNLNLSSAQAGVTYRVFVDGASTGTFVTGPTTAISYSGLPGGSHSVNIQASFGLCTPVFSTNTLTIQVNTPPTSAALVLSGLNPICAGSSTTMKVNIAGGTAPFSFTITGLGLQAGYVSGTAITVSPVATTTYTLSGLVTDANGCTVNGTGTLTITVNPLPTAVITSAPGAICGGGNSTLTFTLTGTPPFNVSYSDGTTTFNLPGITTGHTTIVSPATTKTYTITAITDATTCPGVPGSNTTVTVNPPPTSAALTLTGANPICAGQSTTLKVNIVGGTGPYNFTITGLGPQVGYVSGTAITVTPAVTTTYVLAGNIVTDSKGCSVAGTGTVPVTVNPLPTAVISASPSAFCAGQGNSTLTFTLTGTPPFNVIYTDGVTPVTLNGITTGHTVVVTPPSTTTYTITSVTDATTCAGVAGSNTVVTVSTPPSTAALSLNGSNPICAGQSTTLKVNIVGGIGPYNFTITGLGPQVAYVSGTPITVSPAVNTTYSLAGNTVTDSKGCTVVGAGSVSVTVNPLPTGTVSAAPGTICAGQGNSTLTFTLTGTAPFNVIYTDGVTPVTLTAIASGHTVVVSPAVTTTYTITSVTDATTCAGVAGSNAIVNVNIPPTSATLSLVGVNPVCQGGSTTLKVTIAGGTGPFNFTIPGLPAFVGYVSGTPITITPASTTTFDLTGITVTDSKGCTVVGAGSVTITVNPTPTAVIAASPAAICAGQGNATLTFTLTGTSPFNVTYGDGASTFNLVGITTGHTVVVSPLATTTYTITAITDAGSCAGVTGSNAVVNVSTPATSAALTLVGASTICVGQSTTLKVTITGGTGPFDFTIPGVPPQIGYVSGGAITVSPAATATFDLTAVVVTDSKGCTVSGSGSVLVTVTPAPTAVVSGGGPVCAGAPLPNVTFTFTGTAPFTFTYTDGSTNFNIVNHPTTVFTITNAPAGTYSLLALSDANCVASTLGTPVTVSVNPLPTSVVSGGGPTCSGSPLPNVTFTFTGTAPFNFTYSDGATSTPVVGNATNTFTINNAAAGTYSITALTDNSGCTGNSFGAPVAVTVNPLPTATASGGGTQCFGLPLPGVTFTFTGTPPFDFTYSDGATSTAVIAHPALTYTIANAPAGTYSIVSLKDNNGCFATSFGASAAVVITPLATATISGSVATCVGGTSNLSIALTGTPPWNIVYTDGSTNFPVNGIASSPLVVAVSPVFTTTYSMVSVTDSNCGAGTVSGTATVTVNPIPGNPATAGIDTWLGYVYDDSGDPSPYPAKANFSNTKYRGFIDETDIGGMSPFSSYNSGTDAFDMNITNNASGLTVHAATVCGAYNDDFSVRFRMTKTFAQGIYTFTVGGDDGVRLLLDGVNIIPGGFVNQAYKTYTSVSQCISAGPHDLVLEYFENGGFSRVSFDYQLAPSPVVTTPVTTCVNSPAPVLTASSADPGITGFHWYKDAALTTLLFSGANFTPAAADLNMAVVATTSFFATGVYACGETQALQVDVSVVSTAAITPPPAPAQICQSAGIIDLTTIVSAVPGGGSFTFSGTGVTVSPSFDPTLVAGTTTITANYTSGTCTATTTFTIDVISTATITVPATPVAVCQTSAPVDMTTLVSATPLGGAYTFTGPGVTVNSFDPSAQSGPVAITVSYNAGGCIDTKTLNFSVSPSAMLTISNTTVCPAAGLVDLATLVSAVPAGGVFTFTGTGVAGNNFDPSAQAGSTANINISYVMGGCTAVGTVAVTVRNVGDPLCGGGAMNCNVFTVTITDTRPSCSNQNDGVISINVTGGSPNYVVTLTDGGAFNQALPGAGPVFNFINLSPANYQYTILDGVGNTCTLPHSLPVQATVQATAGNFIDANCFNQPVGGATINVISGGAAPYEYSIDGGSTWISFTSPVAINNLMPAAAPYSILVRDGPGDLCPAQVMVTINNAVTDIIAPTLITDATCANNDGSVQIGAISGGVGPYTYALDGNPFATLPPANTFTNLAGGAHVFSVIDANSCNKPFPFNIGFPGQVNFTTVATNPDCAGNGTNGALTVTITSIGTFTVGYSTDPAVPPASFQTVSSAGSGVVNFINLGKGTYYISAQATGAQCPTVLPATIGSGPNAIDFQLAAANVVCFEDQGGVVLTSITGEPSVDYTYQILNLGLVVQAGTITSLQALSAVTLTALNKGDYQIRLQQDQSAATGCATPIASAYKPFTVTGPVASLDTLYIKKTISFPDIATGTLLIGIQESGLEPYEVRIEPIAPTAGVAKDWTAAARNPQDLHIEYKVTNLFAGSYAVSIRDGFGCERDYTINLDVYTDVFIPNIFTPNGDNVNDVFFIRNGEGAVVVITNRWGKEVFKSGNYQNDWGGGGIDDGVYYYRIVAAGKTFNGWLEIQRGQ